MKTIFRLFVFVVFLHCVISWAAITSYGPRFITSSADFSPAYVNTYARYQTAGGYSAWMLLSYNNSSQGVCTPAAFDYWAAFGTQSQEVIGGQFSNSIVGIQSISRCGFSDSGSTRYDYFRIPGNSQPQQNTNCFVIGSVKNPGAVSVLCTWALLSGPEQHAVFYGVTNLAPFQWWTPSWTTNGAGCPLRFEFVIQEGPSGYFSSTNWTSTNSFYAVNTNAPITNPNVIEQAAGIPDASPAGILGGSTSNAVTQADARLNTAAIIGAGAQQSSNVASRVSLSVSNAVDRRPGDFVEELAKFYTNQPPDSLHTNDPLVSGMWSKASALASDMTNKLGQAMGTFLGPGYSGVSTAFLGLASSEEAPASFWRLRFKGGLTVPQAAYVVVPAGDSNISDSGFDLRRWFTGVSDLIPNFNSWLRWFFLFIEIVILFGSVIDLIIKNMTQLLKTPPGASGVLSTGVFAQLGGQLGSSALLAIALTALLLLLPSLITVMVSVLLSFVTTDFSGTITYLAASPTKSANNAAFSFRAVFFEANKIFPLWESLVFAANYWIVKQISDFTGILGRLAYRVLSMFA